MTVNNYIKYLNSMNNANSSNENAIAESQISNPYYEKIRVDRNIGEYIIQKIKQAPNVVILTGHAGDGKTGLLYQILKSLNALNGNSISKFQEVYSQQLNTTIFYVKDMSELNKEEQINVLKHALDIKNHGGSSILISNTGPLIEAFKGLEQAYPTGVSMTEIEMNLLKLMDENNGGIGKVGKYDVLLINMARIDNVIIIPRLLRNLLADDLWIECNNCESKKKCPIYHNYLSVKENYVNVEKFISSYYRWLYETDRRLTIRQILSQISYSLTGNLTCDDIKNKLNGNTLFNYHFSNLFFGYVGVIKNKDALQIKAIQELQNLQLDSKELPNDYSFFVQEDFSFLTQTVKMIIQPIWNSEMRRYTTSSSDLLKSERARELRKAVRRAQILFGNHDEDSISNMLNMLFSPVFSEYLKIRSKQLNLREIREIRNKIVKALYTMFVGFPMGNFDEEVIYLPVNRKEMAQPVQLLLGKIEASSIHVEQNYITSVYDREEGYYRLELRFENVDGKFPISLMLLDYFNKVVKGAVSTKLNPSLSHGVDKLKSKLYQRYRFNGNQTEIKILIHTAKGPKIITLEIYDKGIYVK
ncbi:hypothetical protein JV16_01872 [Anoxybacillus ayderensis]|uniref:DNA phosphorothioation-dependent restriction protein DptF n=1 Tax=Anoxybacillus ayderensis TaxID=265546 RepID=A0A0D0G6H3_9BACL|nr:hypothetical protein [Anoxybacillus ayderensis]KIP20970.1 hypothetical protein JV16_01872 [Anoxybacillus ayderensis]